MQETGSSLGQKPSRGWIGYPPSILWAFPWLQMVKNLPARGRPGLILCQKDPLRRPAQPNSSIFPRDPWTDIRLQSMGSQKSCDMTKQLIMHALSYIKTDKSMLFYCIAQRTIFLTCAISKNNISFLIT